MTLDEMHPKDIMGYYFNPDRRVYVGSVVIRNVPGALAAVATALGKEGVNLVASESANIEGRGRAAGDSLPRPKIRSTSQRSGH